MKRKPWIVQLPTPPSWLILSTPIGNLDKQRKILQHLLAMGTKAADMEHHVLFNSHLPARCRSAVGFELFSGTKNQQITTTIPRILGFESGFSENLSNFKPVSRATQTETNCSPSPHKTRKSMSVATKPLRYCPFENLILKNLRASASRHTNQYTKCHGNKLKK